MIHESWKEISLQSHELRKTFSSIMEQSDVVKAFLGKPGDVIFLGCGSSYWLSMSAARTFSLHTGRRAYAVKAGEVLMNPREFASVYDNPVLICPSRSGRSTEQLEAIRILRGFYGDIPVLAIVEYEDTELEKLAQLKVRLPWANEASVCQTRSFSCLYLATTMFAAIVSGNGELLNGLERYLKAAPELHQASGQIVSDIVSSFSGFQYLIALGSGRQYGVAIEGAYIGIEMALLKASYYSVLELRHGPIVTVGEDTLVAILSNGTAKSLEEDMAADARRQGAKVLAVVDERGFSNADWVFELGGTYPPEAVALHFIFLMQAFAYWQAVRLGLDPDKPGDLVPYITLQ